MIIIPTGTDIVVKHRPWTTLALVSVMGLISIAIWLVHPDAAFYGEAWLPHAQEAARLEALDAAIEAGSTSESEDSEAASDPVARTQDVFTSARAELQDDQGQPTKLTAQSAGYLRQYFNDLRSESDINDEQLATLTAALAKCPIVEAWEMHDYAADMRSQLVTEDGKPGAMTAEDSIHMRETLDGMLGENLIKPEQHAALIADLERCRMVHASYLYLMSELDGDVSKPISTSTRDRVINGVSMQIAAGDLYQTEADEILAKLATRRVVGDALVFAALDSVDQVPWYLQPYGAWSNPLRWLVCSLVHVHWRDALVSIALLGSLALAIEGQLGWRRFAPMLLGLALVTGLLTMISGLFSPVIMPAAGSSRVLSALIGVLLVWMPSNRIQYSRWFIVELGSFEIPIWGVATFGTVIGTLLQWWAGLPILGVLVLTVGCIGIGIAVGYTTLRLGWVDCEGWDILSLWRTRHMMASERNSKLRESRHLAVGNLATTAAETQAALRQTALESLAEAQAAGQHIEAWAIIQRGLAAWPDWKPPRPALEALLKALWAAKDFTASEALAERLVASEASDGVQPLPRLVLAALAIQEQRRPARGRKHLDAIPESTVTPAVAQKIAALRAKAAQLDAEGVLEMAD